MLAAGARRKDVVVVAAKLVDPADGVDVGERAVQHDGHDDEVVVRMHVVARAIGREDLVAEHLHGAEARDACLIFVEVEARMAGDGAIGMARDVARVRSDGGQMRIAALSRSQHEAHAHAGPASA
ncbi:MAG TPA: hypothetical protein VE963_06925 [Reyranella sp.]|nr:hypothetical protein [Reyranella sp.]